MSASAHTPDGSDRNVGELPIAALINPKTDHAPTGGAGRDRRRKSERIRRMLPTTLEWGGRRSAAQSIEIGYGGMSVLSPARARPPVGDMVKVLIRVGGKAYRDDFRVIGVQVVPEGTMIRLSLTGAAERVSSQPHRV